ncbi:hypothetical protein TPHA_0D02670 [Tetrapisispora phaffii CBS 4417]|uniref:Man1/Src1 C-terminal domain-containing protein n=1 Tax=Tetrapisispora phaffii (strain ATCC 24235 / CBS 4417 / NBRC 1672 / NRRL Y-8282 / UCD 70-5) TaxID=1071381 RepID=G8BST3_TETPH|nr:hypothetical protein TPHA_0D02670 [Tetrapisispora phaffii CBS 4417]CCE62904.1 hypothetical protein TPHA_0D02670 [Tetrapisispora phaffii CBS 4417]
MKIIGIVSVSAYIQLFLISYTRLQVDGIERCCSLRSKKEYKNRKRKTKYLIMETKLYLNKHFKYKNLKVSELKEILAENNVEFPSKAKKSTLLNIYRTNIYKKIPHLRKIYNLSLKNDVNNNSYSGESSESESLMTSDPITREPSLSYSPDISSSSKKRKHIELSEKTPIKTIGKLSNKEKDTAIDQAEDYSTPKKKKQKHLSNDNRISETSIIHEKLANKSPIKIESPMKIFKSDTSENSIDTSNDSFISNSTVLNTNTKLSNKDDAKMAFRKGSQKNDHKIRRSIPPDLALLKSSKLLKNELKKSAEERSLTLSEDHVIDGKSPGKILQKNSDSESISKDEKKEINPSTAKSAVSDNSSNNSIMNIKKNLQDECTNKKQSKLVHYFYQINLFLIIMLPVLFSLWYREQRILMGFCGHELPTRQIIPAKLNNEYPALSNVNAWLESLTPSCLECPANTICYEELNVKCKPDFYLTSNFYTLYGLLPIPRQCIKDDKRTKIVDEVIKKSLEILRAKNAQIDCGENSDEQVSGFAEDELYDMFKESKDSWITDEEFDKIWEIVITKLKMEPEISWRQIDDLNTINKQTISNDEANEVQRQKGNLSKSNVEENKRFFRSSSKKYIGLKCQFERQIYQTYLTYKLIIWCSIITLVIAKYTEYKLRKYFHEKQSIDIITKKVLIYLKECKAKHIEDFSCTPYASTVQLRDVFLSDIVNLQYKNAVWRQVVKNIEHNNTNIKSSLLEIHGEIMKCWEWIGDTNLNKIDASV